MLPSLRTILSVARTGTKSFCVAGLCFWLALPAMAGQRTFHFQEDTFDFPNELITSFPNDPYRDRPGTAREKYGLHCFVLARAASQFLEKARFEPKTPKTNEMYYAKAIREIRSHSSMATIPGYSNLREFSKEHEGTLKQNLGGKWRSYFQRGNWRMVFPFSRRGQAHEASRLKKAIDDKKTAVVHLVNFPRININHAVLLHAYTESEEAITFSAYDPNLPDLQMTLSFQKQTRTFHFPKSFYFPGGAVNAYQIYRNFCF